MLPHHKSMWLYQKLSSKPGKLLSSLSGRSFTAAHRRRCARQVRGKVRLKRSSECRYLSSRRETTAVLMAFVLGVCMYHIAHQSAMQSLRQAGRNQEMVVFTQGIYEARELALARMQAEAAQAGTSGIAGVSVEVNNHVWGEHATEFLATGTAVRRLADEHRLPETSPKPTFTLGLDS